MGRYSAPILEEHCDSDDDDIGQAMAMDWTAISSEDDSGGGAGDLHGSRHMQRDCGYRYHDCDGHCLGRSICYGTLRGGMSSEGCHGMENDELANSGSKGTRRAGFNSSDYLLCRENHHIGHHADATTESSRESLLCMTEEHLEQYNNFIEMQRLPEKRRARMRAIVTVSVAIVAIVLKRHAPPPPPLPGFTKAYLSNEWGKISVETSVHDRIIDIAETIQHETWAGYLLHCFCLVHCSLANGFSVASYAVSNSFLYELEGAKDTIASFLRSYGVEHWFQWNDWVKEMISMASRWQTEHDSNEIPDVNKNDDSGPGMIKTCPIRIPAASKRLNGDTGTGHQSKAENVMEGWSTEEALRQTIGASLPSQNLALRVIAEGLDAWWGSMVENPPEVEEDTLSEWILPPAAALLLVGPEGVGKLHAARRASRLLLGLCAGASSTSTSASAGLDDMAAQELEGVLEVVGDREYRNHGAQGLIVDHIRGRNLRNFHGTSHLWPTIIIIHHIELLPLPLLANISKVLSGKTDMLSYHIGGELVEARCAGTFFFMTSKKWGTESILRHGGLMNASKRESLISSVRWEVESRLGHGTELSKHTTIAPFLPLQQEDLKSILYGRVQALGARYEGLRWKRLEVSHSALKHFSEVGMKCPDVESSKKKGQCDVVRNSFPVSGAHALESNSLWHALETGLATGGRERPGLTLRLGSDSGSGDVLISWCDLGNDGIESCEVERPPSLI